MPETTKVPLESDGQFYRSIVENQTLYIDRFLPGGILTYVNAALAHFAGVTAEELLGKSFYPFLHEEDRPGVIQTIESLTPENPIAVVESRVVLSGRVYWLQWEERALLDGGTIVGYQAVGQDITAQKEAELKLLESERRYRAVVEDQGEHITRYRPDKSYTFVNDSFCRFFNKRYDEVIGTKWQPQVHPDDLCMVEERLSQITPERPIAVVENRVVSGDGTVRWMQVVNRGFFDTEGRLVETQAVGRDITELKKTQVTLREYSRRLINLEEELRKDLSRELHDDIGQQLTALDFNLAYLDKHVAKDSIGNGAKLRSALDDSRLLTKEIQRTMRNLMVELRPVQLDDLGLGGAINTYANQFGKRNGIATRAQIDSPLPRLSTKAEVALFRIAQEALTNAAKYAQASGVRVLLERDGDLIRLSVIDNGIGFEPQEANRHPQGTGWGHTIMRERAAMAGGRLILVSKPGAGTSVVVEVRVAE
jgi:two-component system, NarL family, sensor histidine kinase UhpB